MILERWKNIALKVLVTRLGKSNDENYNDNRLCNMASITNCILMLSTLTSMI